jgi:bromodomain-containing factor 1
MFKDPVDPVNLGIPDYYEIVKRPMDFNTVGEKLKFNEYENIQKFTEDVELVFYNCKLYNGENNVYGMAATQLNNMFKAQWEKLGVDYYK